MSSNSPFGKDQGKPFITTKDLQTRERGRHSRSIREKFIVFKIFNPKKEGLKLEGAGGSYLELNGETSAYMNEKDYEEIKGTIGLDRLIGAGLKITGLDQNAVDKILIENQNKENNK